MDKTVETIQITLPSSKSLSNRWLVLDYLSRMGIKIKNISSSEDTQQLSRLLRQLKQGRRHNFDCHDAGTAARFLLALLSVTPGSHVLTGSEQLCRRPMGQLIEALRSVGCQITCTGEEGHLPCKIEGVALPSPRISIDCSVSSQFASSLLLAAACMPQGGVIELQGAPASEPYIDMTINVMEQAKVECLLKGNPPAYHVRHIIPQCDVVVIEKDWSSASYFFEAASLLPNVPIRLPGLLSQSLQGDHVVKEIFSQLGLTVNQMEQSVELICDHTAAESIEYDFTNCPDLVPAVAVACAALGVEAHFTGVKNLRYKESDRLVSIVDELARLGRNASFDDNTLTIEKGTPMTAESLAKMKEPICTHQDHRIAMAFGVLKVIQPKLTVDQPDVVAKSFPDFWKMLDRLVFVE
ncbi:MAG: 3-phosphoshikimate 1-carboxyvinyltransferase [Bacteroidales bacterium]|nr:3-phosphoshikimate 1-carboxyvinyltransferase [Bacteroidales bacterium]